MSPLLLAGAAVAAGYSTDIELVRPVFSNGVLPGFESAVLMPPGTVRVGLVAQYERDPLVLYEGAYEDGAVVHDRLHTTAGVSLDLTRRLSARLTVPFAGQWGSEVPALSGDGFGMGDVAVGGRFRFLDLPYLSTAVRGDVTLPLGAQNLWIGEQSVRGFGGLVAEAKIGPARVAGDVGVIGRQAVDTGEDFTLGSELALAGTAMLDVWPDHVAVGAGVLSRAGFPNLWGGGAENPVELVAGGQFRTIGPWQVDVGFGRGLAAGYGTTQFRGWAGLTWVHLRPPKLPKVAPVVAYSPVTPDVPDDLLVIEPEPESWKPQELARVEETEIVIRDPIQFELATANILPESLPTLEAIARLLSEHPEIAHIVVEGHASEEGSFAYNYDLSVRRSLAIFQALVTVGVHPARVSCRGMGEVAPVQAGLSEAELAKNRRVIFHIMRRLHAGEAGPAMTPDLAYPWSGEPAKFDVAKAPDPPKPPEEEAPKRPPATRDETDPDQFREEDEPR
ncbi:MAG: OmpA family protein [Myxococcota bacterium]